MVGAISGVVLLKCMDTAYAVGKFYSALNNVLNVLGKQRKRNEMLAVHLVKTYCIPTLLYGCEVCSLSGENAAIDCAVAGNYRKPFSDARRLVRSSSRWI